MISPYTHVHVSSKSLSGVLEYIDIPYEPRYGGRWDEHLSEASVMNIRFDLLSSYELN